MYQESDSASYRPAYNPAFLEKVQAKQVEKKKRQDELEKLLERERLVAKRREQIAEKVAERRRLAGARDKAAVPQHLPNLKGGPLLSFSEIVYRICLAMNVSKAEVLSERRNKHVALARHAICYWAYRRTTLSMPKIGGFLGGRDHTTVMHSVRVYPKLRAAQGRTLRPARS
jgi:chromosomal replication initiator protein